MTASQGMMLAERPSGSMVDPTPTIGNYKGVMLCNRPFAGAAVASIGGGEVGAGGTVGAGRFVTGVVKSEVGFGAAHTRKQKQALRREKKDNALSRHRKWLMDLQKTKDMLEHQYLEEQQRKQDTTRRFMKREAKMRQYGRDAVTEAENQSLLRSIPPPLEDHIYDVDAADVKLELESPIAEDKEGGGGGEANKASGSGEAKKSGQASKRRPMPKWALTEEKAADVEEAEEEDEVEQLLAFTKTLDFDKYIRDAEVQGMIDQVQKRIRELEKERAAVPETDEGDEGSQLGDSDGEGDAGGEAAMEARIMRLTDANLRKMGNQAGEEEQDKGEDDALSVMSIARTVMSEGGRSVRSIHSRKSLAAIVERSQTKLGGGDTEAAINVKLVVHKDDGGLRLGGKNTVSNLPYIHRNPAV